MKLDKRKLIRIICMITAIGAAGYILWYYYLAWSNRQIYDAVFNTLSKGEQEERLTEEEALLYPNYQLWNDAAVKAFQQKNKDVIGILYIPDTPLQYPVVMTEKESGSYYLYRDLNGKRNINGTVFADYRAPLLNPDMRSEKNERGKSTPATASNASGSDLMGDRTKEAAGEDMQNIILYGHNMKNGSMFGTVRRYTDPAFFEAHPMVYFNYGQKNKRYEICSVITLSAKDPYDRLLFGRYTVLPEEKEAFVRYLKERSLYKTGVHYGTEDSYLILLTCYRAIDEGRVAVVAREIPEEN